MINFIVKGTFSLKAHFNDGEHENELCMKFSFYVQRTVSKPKLLIVSVCRDARVVKDMATGKSKGYGFVSFFNKWVSATRSACAVL